MQHFTASTPQGTLVHTLCAWLYTSTCSRSVCCTVLYYDIIGQCVIVCVGHVYATVQCLLIGSRCHLHIFFSPCIVSHCRGLVCLTCWPSARVSKPLSCTSTKVQNPSLPSTTVWRECAAVHPLRVCQSAVWMQVSGVQHWVSCCVGAVWCMSPMALSVSNVFLE